MQNTKLFTVICLCVWYFVSGAFAVHIKQNATAHITKKNKSNSTASHLTRNERNRRLIPYATYYIAGGHDQNNFIHANPLAEEESKHEDDQLTTPKSIQRPPVNHHQKTHHYLYNDDYRQDSANGYSYIPIAYIPGVRGISYNPESHYYPNSYHHNPVVTEYVKSYTTAKPKHAITTSSNTAKKGPFSYFSEFLTQKAEAPANGFFRYVVTPETNSKSYLPNAEDKKPGYQVANNAPILFTTPQTDFLNFRYSDLYKTQGQKYDYSTTPPTVEITSPKHYIVPNGGTTSTTTNQPDPLVYEYPEVTQFAYSVPLTHSNTVVKPVPSTLTEQSTQSSKTHTSVMKSKEIQYPQEGPTYQMQYPQKPYTEAGYSVDDIFRGYNFNEQLPERITSENIKESIKTLSYILQILQKADSITQFQKQPDFYSKDLFESLKESPLLSSEEHKSVNALQNVDVQYHPYDIKESITSQIFPDKSLKDDQNTPGRAGIDYPIYSIIPQTSFTCKSQRYKGFFADPDTKCQVWHYCDLNGGQASFLCPNGTIFNQAALTCDWWFNVKCASTPQLYVLNERLYKYIIPVRPSFPEDYSGPLVDQYLTEKFKETESKRKYRYPTNMTTAKPEHSSSVNLTSFSEYDIPAHLLNANL